MSNKIKYKIWLFLEHIDSLFNHRFYGRIFDLFPLENKDGSDSLAYKIWLNTSVKFCEFIVIDLYDKWFKE